MERSKEKWTEDHYPWSCSQAFGLMDQDKDGIIGKNDLRAAFDTVGRLATDKELDEMLDEASAPINFTQLLNLFAVRMSGSGMYNSSEKSSGVEFSADWTIFRSGADEDEVVINAFKTFDVDGKIDGER